MNDDVAQQLLATVMGWHKPEKPDDIQRYFPDLQLLANYKYDSYQQFSHGRHFIESLALWLDQFDELDRQVALDFVREKLIFISDAEFFHLVNIAYPDVVVPERMRLVAEESGIPLYRVEKIVNMLRFKELELKSLYLGLSDGARTSEFRRASGIDIRNDQIWQAYEIGKERSEKMLEALDESIKAKNISSDNPKFTLVWLLDDFTASGNTYIRFKDGEYKGKLPSVFETLLQSKLVDVSHFEVFLLFYVATQQAIDHIEYWMERFTTSKGYKPLQIRVIHLLEPSIALKPEVCSSLIQLIKHEKYYDQLAESKATRVGGTVDVRFGFANCALPVVLCHNTPNNSIYLLWGEDTYSFPGLFPRVSRHRDI